MTGHRMPDTATGRPRFTVASGRVDLWLLRSPHGADADQLDRSELDEEERARAASFLRSSHRVQYTAAHIALRRLLGRYTGTPAQDIRFVREPCPGCGAPHGRPSVLPLPSPLHFSLSHSGGVALVGIAAVPHGVDVERLPTAGTIEVCSRALHPDEQAELAEAGPGSARHRALLGRVWTRKEAYLKGLGIGLRRSPGGGLRGRRHQSAPPRLDHD